MKLSRKSIRISIAVAFFLLATALQAYGFDSKSSELSFSEVYSQYNSAINSGNTADSLRLAKLALELGEKKYGKATENVANLKYNLALSYRANIQPKKAFNVFDQVAEDYQRLYGEYSAELMQVLLEQISLNKLYKDYRNNLDFEEVDHDYASLIRQVRDIAEEIAEDSPHLAAGTYYNFARVMNSSILSSRFFKYAFSANEKAEKYLLASVGDKDARTVEIRFMLGKYMDAKGRKDSAIEYFESVVSTISSQIDTSHPFELASHAALVDLYERNGKSEKATKHCLAIGNLTPWNDDIDPIPLYRLSPTYPPSAARMGKEGAVVLSFSIDTLGFVKDIKVIKSSSKLFNEVAIEALKKWRYAPKVLNGQSIIAVNNKVQLDFKLRT